MNNSQIWENKKINKKIKTPELLKSKMPYVFANLQSGSDLWTTPEYAVEILLPYLKKYENKIIWCPFDDETSEFVKIFKKNKINVICSHLKNKQDFFIYEPKEWDIIISNPPWSIKDKILKRCYELNKPFALILPIHSISGKYRWELFKQNKLQILCSKNRICFNHKKNYKHNRPPFESGYFCYKFLPKQICWEK